MSINTPAGSKEYLKNAVMTASPEQLQLMLLDGAIRFATRGREAITANNIEATFKALDRAQRIVLELSNGIRREVNPQLADRTLGLYGFIYRRLIDGNLHRNLEAVDDALRILRHQRETWALLIDKIWKESQPTVAAGTAPVEPASSDDGLTGFVAQG
jgi:flagellar protein FliS